MSSALLILPPLIIVEGIVFNYALYFKMIYGEFLQTHKGTKNDMIPRIINLITINLSGNLQGRIRCFSLQSSRILNRV